jgi:hypothetical protein
MMRLLGFSHSLTHRLKIGALCVRQAIAQVENFFCRFSYRLAYRL